VTVSWIICIGYIVLMYVTILEIPRYLERRKRIRDEAERARARRELEDLVGRPD
jgi:hypothetical protein